MKNKIVYTLFLLGIIMSCKAQIVSLDVMSQCNGTNCPDYTYVKDTNNRLNKFVGTWKGTYTDGRTYEFHFVKKENDGGWFNEKFWDKLIGRVIVKSANGNIIYSSLAESDLNSIGGLEFVKNLTEYQMYYAANANCNDKGYIYISFPDPNNLNQMKLYFMQDLDIASKCPTGYQTIMQDAKDIILTKH
ncbi:DUF6705 family protein [Chryseobacterium sp.]|uniref:DUF6705 family protein n=1 Tax=Chryseobacterium sp. TaxID=1871047 RepID=UPI002FC976CC